MGVRNAAADTNLTPLGAAGAVVLGCTPLHAAAGDAARVQHRELGFSSPFPAARYGARRASSMRAMNQSRHCSRVQPRSAVSLMKTSRLP